MTALSQPDAWQLCRSQAARAEATFIPSETSIDELAGRIALTWMFETSVAGPLVVDILVKFTRPASHFSGDRVLAKYRDAVFPGFDEEIVHGGVIAGLTTAAPLAAPRVASPGQICSVTLRAQWTIAGSREKPRVIATLERPVGSSYGAKESRAGRRFWPVGRRAASARPLAFA